MKTFLVFQFFFILSLIENIITSTSWNKYCHRYPCPQYKVLNKTRDYEVREYPMSRWAVAQSQESDGEHILSSKYTQLKYLCPRLNILNLSFGLSPRRTMITGQDTLQEISVQSKCRNKAKRVQAIEIEGVELYWANLQNKAKLSHYRLGKNEENVKMSTTYPSVIRMINPKRGSELIKEFTSMYYIPDKFQKTCPTPLAKGGETEVDLMEWESRIAYVRSFSRWITESWLRYYARHLSDSLKRAGIEFEEYYVYYSSYNTNHQFWHRHAEVMFLKQPSSLNKLRK